MSILGNYAVGSDAEVILKDKSGKYRSAIGLIGGSKTNPRPTKHGFVQEDNVLAEFNVNPSRSEQEFILNTKMILADLNEIIQPLDFSVDIKASALFELDQLTHPLALLAGCEPDYDAWDLVPNEKPELEGTQLRSCGGHVHVSFDNANNDPMHRPNLVRVLDLVAAIPAVIMDTDTRRRSLYGKAGCHRPKSVDNGDAYDGVEYRTLSNFWLRNERTMGWVYRTVDRAVTDFSELLKAANAMRGEIVDTINMGNVKKAEEIVRQFDLEVVNG